MQLFLLQYRHQFQSTSILRAITPLNEISDWAMRQKSIRYHSAWHVRQSVWQTRQEYHLLQRRTWQHYHLILTMQLIQRWSNIRWTWDIVTTQIFKIRIKTCYIILWYNPWLIVQPLQVLHHFRYGTIISITHWLRRMLWQNWLPVGLVAEFIGTFQEVIYLDCTLKT